MIPKNRISETSLAANERVKPKKENQRGIIEAALKRAEGYPMNAKFIAAKTGLRLESVNGRINEMLYKYQTVKIVSVINDCQGYALRLEADPLNVRPKSQAEILSEKIKAIQSYLGLSDAKLNEIIEQGRNNLFAKG